MDTNEVNSLLSIFASPITKETAEESMRTCAFLSEEKELRAAWRALKERSLIQQIALEKGKIGMTSGAFAGQSVYYPLFGWVLSEKGKRELAKREEGKKSESGPEDKV